MAPTRGWQPVSNARCLATTRRRNNRQEIVKATEDVRASTLRHYLEVPGARLELVAVFDDDARRVPVHLGKGSAA